MHALSFGPQQLPLRHTLSMCVRQGSLPPRPRHTTVCAPACYLPPAGVDDVAVAMNVLEATNWSLEDAINLQFATGGDVGGGGGVGGSGGAGGAGGAAGPAGLPPLDEEDVRAPMPVMRDRLYGDAGMHGIPARGGGVAR